MKSLRKSSKSSKAKYAYAKNDMKRGRFEGKKRRRGYGPSTKMMSKGFFFFFFSILAARSISSKLFQAPVASFHPRI